MANPAPFYPAICRQKQEDMKKFPYEINILNSHLRAT